MPPDRSLEDSRRRAARAAQLRATGRTWQQIATEEGFRSRRAAQLAVKRLRDREHPESITDKRATAADGLRIVKSILFAALAEAKLGRDTGQVVAVSRALTDTIDKAARLEGLHVPVAAQVDVNVTDSRVAVITRLENELLALASEQQPRLPVIDGEVIE